jgi:hypothetical protein
VKSSTIRDLPDLLKPVMNPHIDLTDDPDPWAFRIRKGAAALEKRNLLVVQDIMECGRKIRPRRDETAGTA